MFTKEFMNRKHPQVNSMKDVRKLNNIYQIMWFNTFFSIIWIVDMDLFSQIFNI